MSINTVTDMTLTDLAAIFDMSEKKAAFLEGQGCKMKVGHKAIVFESANAQHIASANVKMGVLNMAKSNKLGPASKSMIQDELAGAIDKLCDKLGFGTSIFDDEDAVEEADSAPPNFETDSVHVKNEVEAAYALGSGTDKVKAIKKLRSLTGLGLKEAKELVEKWIDNGTIGDGPKKEESMFEGIFSKKKKAPKKAASTKIKEGIMNTNVIQLKDATDVFQPVSGSGGTSVYFAIAIGDETNVAARIKGQKVSIRVEGKGVSDPEIRQTLIDAGLSEAGGGHFSLHLSVEPHLLKKTIGAVLFAIGQPFTQMTADVTPIMGKGS